MTTNFVPRFTNLLFLILAFALKAEGALLDWDTLSWSSGTLSQTYSTGVGTTVTITVSGSTGGMVSNTPALNSYLTGGLSPAQKSLQLAMNQPNNTSKLTVTVTFNNYTGGIASANFMLFDTDYSNVTGNRYQDVITNIYGLKGVTQVAAHVTGSSANTVANNDTTTVSVTGNASANDSSANGNVTVSFSSPINSFTFTYGNGPSAPADPTVQWISLFDINYVPALPEIGVSKLAMAFCLLVILVDRRPFRWLGLLLRGRSENSKVQKPTGAVP